MKIRMKLIAALLVLALMLSCVSVLSADRAYAATQNGLKRPQITAGSASYTSIAVKWKRIKNAKGYELYRYDKNSGKYKKIKTIKKGTTLTYLNRKLQRNKLYSYKVRAYQYIGGKKKYSPFSYSEREFSGVGGVNVHSDQHDNTCRTVSLSLSGKSHASHSGFELYRKNSETGIYEKIGTKKAKAGRAAYMDKSLTPQTTYAYKARGYKDTKGKRLYSNFSKTISVKTVNGTPTLDAKILTESGSQTNQIKLSLTNHNYNDKLRLSARSKWERLRYAGEKQISQKVTDYINVDLDLTQFSFDDRTYKPAGKCLDIEPGQTAYLILSSDKEFSFWDTGSVYFPYGYQAGEGFLEIDVKSGDIIVYEIMTMPIVY